MIIIKSSISIYLTLALDHQHYANYKKHVRKCFIRNMIIVVNSLPNDVVLAESTNIFKNRLDNSGSMKVLNLIGWSELEIEA